MSKSKIANKKTSAARQPALHKANVSRRLSSYQKLKLENEELKKDIFLLLKKGDTVDGQLVKARYLLSYSFSDAVMFGDTGVSGNRYSGILNAVANGG